MKYILLFMFVAIFLVGCGESETPLKCELGFEVVNDVCIDINECELERDNCHQNAICTNTEGSFSCECIDSYIGDGINCKITGVKPFITTWKTDNEGVSSPTQITIPTNPNYIYNYNIDCNNDGVFETINVIGNYTCNYSVAGTYQVAIVGDFPAIYFGNSGDKNKILSIDNWGSITWQTMQFAFWGCSNLNLTATDSPDLTNVTNMSWMFSNATSFNGDISGWDVSRVLNIRLMFREAISFNGDISSWNVSNVTDMNSMFAKATSFNGNISSWNVSNVTDMFGIFYRAESFNQDLSSWDVDQVTTCDEFAYNTPSWTLPKPNFTSCNPE